ncbi:putative quinone oxidoreductase, YhdH/YhfP family [Geoalkalibacter ferrihydriticus]|uniref:Quinone oxidoreductase n=2 Tax=Geoalkalibacter ferrihydriticus TaxID=392333 RepID=A0A0C2HUJ6_9BACT|nr:YhdH/YhfP family quinone oxidoreductase [Geoalkalibacter ferrihydriticus]KIH76497.1 quinone oxidoreductase [Geoalkalibacter ferrihydriticus DSM 17813]SDL98356.1 putative quinone oxidoreductase, YhdH/YhfP family [Geoalkalibacter ferrihydriticus]
MSETTFKAMIVEEAEPKKFTRRIGERKISDLPDGDLLIRVHYSSLNFKDALSATGNKAVTRKFPHTPGIDAAGEVVECSCGRYQPGDQVLVTGYDLGMETDGGFGQYIRIPCDWAVKLPDGLSLRESMIIGTAGFTAGLCVWKLEQAGVQPDAGDILVTGASGGVGSIAVSILARLGYRVVAVTGKTAAADFLKTLGAAEVIGREAVLEGAERPMMKERWAGVVDVAGGDLLAGAIKATRYGGAVTCCGLVGSPDLNINVFPFILRGVSLLGVDSVQCPAEPRLAVWEKLAGLWKPEHLEETASECGLEELEEKIQAILKGQIRGRTLVNMKD